MYVDEPYRRKKLRTLLYKRIYKKCDGVGIKFSYSFSSRSSATKYNRTQALANPRYLYLYYNLFTGFILEENLKISLAEFQRIHFGTSLSYYIIEWW